MEDIEDWIIEPSMDEVLEAVVKGVNRREVSSWVDEDAVDVETEVVELSVDEASAVLVEGTESVVEAIVVGRSEVHVE